MAATLNVVFSFLTGYLCTSTVWTVKKLAIVQYFNACTPFGREDKSRIVAMHKGAKGTLWMHIGLLLCPIMYYATMGLVVPQHEWFLSAYGIAAGHFLCMMQWKSDDAWICQFHHKHHVWYREDEPRLEKVYGPRSTYQEAAEANEKTSRSYGLLCTIAVMAYVIYRIWIIWA